jgi:hypothetical protein
MNKSVMFLSVYPVYIHETFYLPFSVSVHNKTILTFFSMRLPLIRSESIELTTIINHRRMSYLYLLLSVRLGGYIVNLCDFYSYRLNRKLTAFLQFQEFNFRNMTVDCSNSDTRCSPHTSSLKWTAPSSRLHLYVLTSTLTGTL